MELPGETTILMPLDGEIHADFAPLPRAAFNFETTIHPQKGISAKRETQANAIIHSVFVYLGHQPVINRLYSFAVHSLTGV